MIRQLAILAVAAVCLAALTSAAVDDEADILKGQKVVFNLVQSDFKDSKIEPQIYKTGQEWDFKAKLANYDSDYQDVLKKFLDRYKLGMLPRGRLFSIYYSHLVDETLLLFKVLYYAPDLWTFIHVAIWASIKCNEYQFRYVFHAALIHRTDTKYIPIRQPYEVHPEFFFNTDVTKQVYDYKMDRCKNGDKVEGTETHVVVANYSNWYITETFDQEYNLTYFKEDIDLSTWYYYFTIRYPFWMSAGEYPEMKLGNRGEIYYYVNKMILNRYKMERLSHGLGEMEFLNWDKPIAIGYFPSMNYPNGLPFPKRPEWSPTPIWKNEPVEILKNFQSRIAEAIDSGYIITSNGTFVSLRNEHGLNVLGNLIHGNDESLNKNYYGSVDTFGRNVLGFSPKPHDNYQILPSALEQTLTSMRDPGFYRLTNSIDSYFCRYNEHLPPYTLEELKFKGVKIGSAHIVEEKLVTYFENIETTISRYFSWDNLHTSIIKARQYRLNHKPFTFNISVDSLEDVRASFRIFMGPQYNVYNKNISNNYGNFYEVDYFSRNLTKGTNIIERKSTDSSWFSFGCKESEIFEKYPVGDEQLHFEKCRFGLPGHLLVPKGQEKGFPIQFFVYISKYTTTPGQQQDPLLAERDNKVFGFPLDRPIDDFSLANMHFIKTVIEHKDEAYINLTNP